MHVSYVHVQSRAPWVLWNPQRPLVPVVQLESMVHVPGRPPELLPLGQFPGGGVVEQAESSTR
jgi:hypothetical protein